jgi:hypothetical protein
MFLKKGVIWVKAVTYQGIKDIQVKEVPDAKIEKHDDILVPFTVACGQCYFCQHDLESQFDNSNENGETGGSVIQAPTGATLADKRNGFVFLSRFSLPLLFRKIAS